MTDSQIIALFWERNEDAIQETDAVYGHKLYTISDKILHSLQDAEESVSDTYMKAVGNDSSPKAKLLFCLSCEDLP